MQNQLFYGVIAWRPALLVERGRLPEAASAHLALYTGVFLVANVAVGLLAGTGRDRRPTLVGTAALYVLGLIGLVTGVSAIGALIAMAIGQAGAFTLGMTLPLDDAADVADAAVRTTATVTIGYVLGSTGPIIVGVARDQTGSLTPGFKLLVVLSAVLLALALTLGPWQRPGSGLAGSEP